MNNGKKIVIIAGPNGAGKTTFAREYLPKEAGCPIFVNADLIATGLSPFMPAGSGIRAGRIMLEEIKVYARKGVNFSFESTLSGMTYAKMIPAWRHAGYRVKLIFLWLPNPEMAVARVASRVAQGGHDIPEDVIRRRYGSGWNNFNRTYKTLVNSWILYDNSSARPLIVEEGS